MRNEDPRRSDGDHDGRGDCLRRGRGLLALAHHLRERNVCSTTAGSGRESPRLAPTSPRQFPLPPSQRRLRHALPLRERSRRLTARLPGAHQLRPLSRAHPHARELASSPSNAEGRPFVQRIRAPAAHLCSTSAATCDDGSRCSSPIRLRWRPRGSTRFATRSRAGVQSGAGGRHEPPVRQGGGRLLATFATALRRAHPSRRSSDRSARRWDAQPPNGFRSTADRDKRLCARSVLRSQTKNDLAFGRGGCKEETAWGFVVAADRGAPFVRRSGWIRSFVWVGLAS